MSFSVEENSGDCADAKVKDSMKKLTNGLDDKRPANIEATNTNLVDDTSKGTGEHSESEKRNVESVVCRQNETFSNIQDNLTSPSRQNEDGSVKDNIELLCKESTNDSSQLQVNDTDDDPPLWTIPEFIIALCSNDVPELDEEQTGAHVVDRDLTGEVDTANVESWNDNYLVQTCSNVQDTQETSADCADAKVKDSMKKLINVLDDKRPADIEDNIELLCNESTNNSSQLQVNVTDDDPPLWTIPEFIIALCSNDVPELEDEQTGVHVVDRDLTGEVEPADVESWNDNYLVQTCSNVQDTQENSADCVDAKVKDSMKKLANVLDDKRPADIEATNTKLDDDTSKETGEHLESEKRDVEAVVCRQSETFSNVEKDNITSPSRENEDGSMKDNIELLCKESTNDSSQLQVNDAVDDPPLWTIPEFVIALCSDDVPELEDEQTGVHVVDKDLTGEAETANVESWNDNYLVQTCSNVQDTQENSADCADAKVKDSMKKLANVLDDKRPVDIEATNTNLVDDTSKEIGEHLEREKRNVVSVACRQSETFSNVEKDNLTSPSKENEDGSVKDNIEFLCKESTNNSSQLQINDTDDDPPLWTIPKVIITLCSDDVPELEEEQTSVHVVNLSGEVETADVETWNDNSVVRTCSTVQNTHAVQIPRTEPNSTQVSIAGCPPGCEQPRSGYEDIGVLPLEQVFSDSNLPAVGAATSDSNVALLEQNNGEDNENTGDEVNNTLKIIDIFI